MTDPSLGKKKKKITIIASPQGVNRAENALIRLGFESKINFAKSQLLSRSTVTKFFQCQPIKLDSFKKICEELTLNWQEIAEISEQKQSERQERKGCSSPVTNEEVEQMQTLRRQVTVIDKQSEIIKAEIILKGDINSIHNLKILQLILQEHSGDTVKITDIREGSIRLFVEGSQEDIERLVSRIQSGELREVNGFPVEDVQVLSESSDDDENNELDEKWRLVQKIVSQPVEGQNLRYADLSDVDLSDVDLSGADLSGADLSGADLNGANLSYADLSYAALDNANLSAADLSAVDLSYADLSDADLSNTDLSAANLRYVKINNNTKLDAKWRLVWEIVNFGAVGQNLSNANLSNANLSGANLSGAFIENADLSCVNLSDADLNKAYLIGARMSGTNLSTVKVKGAIFGDNVDLPKNVERDLKNRGAIFNDSPLIGARMSGTNLSTVKVKGAIFGDNVDLPKNVERDRKNKGAIFNDSPKFDLEETDIDTLINLLLRSQQSRTREALCYSIGIDPKRLSFIRDSSESDFFLLLIKYLNEIGEKEALCKLCCKELLPVFHHGKYAPILSEIAVKLNCNQRLSQNSTKNQQQTVLWSSPDPSASINPFIQLVKNKFIRSSVIVIIGLAGIGFIQFSKSLSNSNTIEQLLSPNKTQQITDIYQKVLGRKPTVHELSFNLIFLKSAGVKPEDISNSIIKTSSLIKDGNVISLECLGNLHTDVKFLDSRIKNNNVSLVSTNIEASTKWKVHIIDKDKGVVALENQGAINGPKWLDGVTENNSVNLAHNIEDGYIGTKWTINILGDGSVALDNQGQSKWLDGVTREGFVRLAPNIEEGYTGTRWEISKQ